jgi:serine/threonine-protein kinase
VGRLLRDKWRIDRRIARGGMGTVYAATHKNNGSTAAIKILHPEFSREKDTRARFLQEGYAANKVNHPGVVRIIDDDVTEEGLAYLVMELLEGELLEQRRIRKGGKLPLAEVYDFGDQLLDVLAAAHAKDIVHRDIKPDNIFLTSAGKLKVLDFGFAQIKTAFRPEQTATGFLLGTPGFMAPEQAIGNRPAIDARTDIWAAGATLFMLLSGQPVHEGESAAEQLVAAANFAVRSIMTFEPTLPTKLAYVIDRALEFDREARWPHARAMQEALRAVPRARGPHVLGTPQPPRSKGQDGPRNFVDDDSLPTIEPVPAVPIPDATVSDVIDQIDETDLSGSGETQAFSRPPDMDVEDTAKHVRHAADLDLETPKFVPPRPPGTLRLGDLSSLDENIGHDETLVMDSRPFRPVSRGPAPSPAQMPSAGPRPSYASYADFPQNAPRASFVAANELPSGAMPVVAPEQRAPGRSSRILVFVALAGITMLVVVVAGLMFLERR